MAGFFGKRKAVAVEEEYETVSEDSTGSSGDYYKFEAGNNLFFMLPVFEETTERPYKAVSVHQKPFHVCGKEAPRVGINKHSEVTKINDKDFKNCWRCNTNWSENGYDTEQMDNEAWRQTSNYKKFRNNASSDKVAFMAIPVSAFFTLETRKVKSTGLLKITVQLREGAKKNWDKFMAEYPEFYRTFKEAKEWNPNYFEFMSFTDSEGKTHRVGISPIQFSFDEWYGTKGSTSKLDIETMINSFITNNKGEAPWGINEAGEMIALLNISSSDRSDFQKIRYTGQVIPLDSETTLSFSEEFGEFFNSLGDKAPDISKVLTRVSALEMREAIKAYRERSGSVVGAPECFGDSEVYDNVSDKCGECKFMSKCAIKIRTSGSKKNDEIPDDEARPTSDNRKVGFQKKPDVIPDPEEEEDEPAPTPAVRRGPLNPPIRSTPKVEEPSNSSDESEEEDVTSFDTDDE